MITQSKIAILLGAYNAEKYIREQLDSILNQTYTDWVLYVRDDASTDRTGAIIQEYASKHERIVMIDDADGNLGCNGNYFRLLEVIDAEYFMFCNADDYWLPNKIEVSVQRMLEMESEHLGKPIVVHTDLAITDHQLNIIYESLWKFNNLVPEKFANFNDIGISSIVAGATALFNKEVKGLIFPVHESAPFFDHWMALQVTKNKGIISSIKIPTVYYRQIGSNLAAIQTGEKNTVIYKLKNIRQIIKKNLKEAKMLKEIGWGGIIKYFIYKVRVFILLRFINKYKYEI